MWFCGKITKRSSRVVKSILKTLNKESHDSTIFLIKSNGGDAATSLEIHQSIHNSESIVNTVAFGAVTSGALLVLQAGDKKFATPKCRFGFHQACNRFRNGTLLNGQDLMEIAYRLMRRDAMEIYILTTGGGSAYEIAKLFNRDADISSRKALKLKIIDGIWKKPIHKL